MSGVSNGGMRQRHLAEGLRKIGAQRAGESKVELWAHEADALFAEFCRLANFATLLGEPSPAEMAGYIRPAEDPHTLVAKALDGSL